jgi:CubicO group peptidase (beta-lactamase class C family)
MILKKLSLYVIGVFVILGVGLSLVGISPSYIASAPQMLTGISAKLACSSKYVSGLSERQSTIDLSSYSPVLKYVDLHFDDEAMRVTSSFFGMSVTSAQYRDKLGCTLSINDTNHLDSVALEAGAPAAADIAWPAGSAASINSNVQNLLDQIMQKDNEAGLQSRSMVVIKDGTLIAESYSEGVTKDSPLLGWSMAKSVASIMLGNLEMKHKLSVDEVGLFDDWQSDQRKDISVENLLHMSSGLDFDEIYEPGADATRMLFSEYDAAGFAIKAPLAVQPGQRWLYASGTTNILTRLMNDRLGGQQHAALKLFHKELFTPLAMQHSIFEPDPSGLPVGSSYLYSSARDWARIGQLMLNGGVLNGHRVVTEDWVKRASTPNHSDNEKRYGYQFWLNQGGEELRWPDLPVDSYAARGNRKQITMIIPSKNMVIVRLGWSQGGYPTNDNFSSLMNAQ